MKVIPFVILFILLTTTASATVATSKGVNASGNDVLWTVLTIGLTLLFARRGIIKLLTVSPIFIVILLVALFVIYIVFSAFAIVYGIGDFMDSQIANTANFMLSIRGQ